MQLLANTVNRKKSSEVDGRLPIRQRFQLASAFLKPLAKLIVKGFATQRKGKTAHGRAMSHLLLRAIQGEYPNQYVNPALAVLSEGVLQNPLSTEVTRHGRMITVEVQSAHDSFNQAWDDRLVLCAYHPALCVAGINDEEWLREAESVALQLPPLLEDKPVHLYLMVHDRDGKRWSNSKYLGEW